MHEQCEPRAAVHSYSRVLITPTGSLRGSSISAAGCYLEQDFVCFFFVVSAISIGGTVSQDHRTVGQVVGMFEALARSRAKISAIFYAALKLVFPSTQNLSKPPRAHDILTCASFSKLRITLDALVTIKWLDEGSNRGSVFSTHEAGIETRRARGNR